MSNKPVQLSEQQKQGLKKPQEWARLEGIKIKDPDGWRTADAPDFDTLITHDEYTTRLSRSTVVVLD